MSKPTELVLRALEYYDSNNAKLAELKSKIRYAQFNVPTDDVSTRTATFFDDKFNKLFESRMEHLGEYTTTASQWKWAWANPINQKMATTVARQILSYGFGIPPESENMYIKTELITSTFKVYNRVQLDIHIAIGAYISKSKFVLCLYDHQKNMTVTHNGQVYKSFDTTSYENDYGVYVIILLDCDQFI